MEKEALISIIMQDIKELETLVNTFRGKAEIPEVYIKLSKSKLQGIISEIELLADIKEEAPKEPLRREIIVKESAIEESPKDPSPRAAAQESQQIAKARELSPEKPVAEDSSKAEAVKEASEADKAKTELKAAEQVQKKQVSPTVLGETLGKDRQALNDALTTGQSSKDSAIQPAINDLKKAIGINDRFLFQRELFAGNTELFNSTVDQINALNNLSEAETFIASNFDWSANQDTAHEFMSLVKRRFQKRK